ncbi:zeta toxin family protein [Streptomyces sp. NPDC002536]
MDATLVKSAPASAPEFVNSALLCHRAGYRVELVVQGVRAADSRQGTAVRYAQVSRHSSRPGRFTTAAGHDLSPAAVAEAVTAAEEVPVVDSVAVTRRDSSAVYRNERSAQRHWLRPIGAIQALTAEWHRPYTTEEASSFLATQRWLRSMLPQYRDEIIQISRLAEPLMPLHLQPHHSPAGRPAHPASSRATPTGGLRLGGLQLLQEDLEAGSDPGELLWARILRLLLTLGTRLPPGRHSMAAVLPASVVLSSA